MKLSAEQFAELAASFDARQSSSHHERRRAARMDLQTRIKISSLSGDERLTPVVVLCSNFSSRGLSFISTVPMETGRQFITELPRKAGGVVELLCAVVHSVPMAANSYRIGAEFTCVVPAGSQNKPATQQSRDEVDRIRQSMMK